jgi:hypothetical protein
VTEPNLRLVADLARLAAKYPSDDWDDLLSVLRDPNRQADLILLVEQLASLSKHKADGRDRTAKGTQELKDELARIRTQDPAKADLLEDVWSKLRRRDLLPDMKAVRTFAETIGMKGLSASRRDAAVNEIMRSLLNMATSDLLAAIQRPVAVNRDSDEEYGKWVRLILGQSEDRGDIPTPQALAPSDGPAEGFDKTVHKR